MLELKKHNIDMNEQFVKQSNDNLMLLTNVAELARKQKLPVQKSYREQFLKEVIDYIV